MPARLNKFSTKNTLSFTALFATVFAFLFLSVMTPVAAAPGINGTINFQGKLQNPNGTNVTDGNYTVVFTLYDAATAGTTLWDETQTVTVTDGIFRVALGSVDTTLPSVNFNSDSLYLGMKVNADAEMTPRIRFTAVPYAFNAQKVNGLTVTNTSDAAFTSATTLKIADGKTLVFNNGLTFTGTDATSFTFPSSSGTIVTEDFTQTLTNKTIGSTGLVFSGATSDMTTPSGEHLALMPGGTGNVGIGTTDPSTFKLQVTGNVGPTTDSLYDLGSTGVRWANGYFDTLYGDGTNLTGIPTTNNIANSYVVSVSGGTYTAKSNSGLTDYSGTSLETVLESATSALSTAGGGRIQFKAGTFDFGTTNAAFNTVNDIVFEGEGIDATIIQNSSDAAADTEPLSFTNSKRITIRDLTVSAGGASRISSDAIDFDQGDDVLVERVKVTASRGRGIVIDGKDTAATADRGIIRDCIITGTVDDGIELLGANQVTISGCKIYDVGGHGINLSKASPTAGQPNKQSNYNVIVGNDITNAGKDGINVNSGSHNKIIGNTVKNSADDTASRDGIRIDSFDSIACDYNIIEGNTSTDDQGTKTQRYGINITSANCNNNTLSNNTVDGNLTNSIVDSGTNTRYSQFIASSNILGMNTNIGIGTTSPLAKLHLTGATIGKALAIFNETGDQDIFTASASGTTRFTIKNNGNVGIGTTDPTKKLHLVGGLMQITNTGQLAGTVLERTDGSAGSLYAGLTFVAFQYDSSYGFAIRSNNRTDVLAGSGTNATTRLYVDGSGNVGIGSSTTVNEKFQVDGRIYLEDSSAPATTTNRLYSVTGNLYWNGTQLGSGGSSAWSSLTAPSGNLSLSMSTHTTGFNWATGTSTNDLFSLTTDASANGTGSLLNIQTGAGSTVLPLRVRAGATEALAVNASGNVGVGTTNPVYPMQIIVTAPDVADGRILDVDGDLTSITNDQSGFKISPAVAPTANTTRAYSGGVFSTSGNSATRLTGATIRGFDAQSSYSGTGTLGTAVGGRYRILNTSTGTITNAYGLFIDAPSNTGTLTNTRGLYLASQAVGTQTNTAYGIYQEGADNYNYFAGNVGIGTTVPTAKLSIGAGTATVAPLKLTSGTNLTSAEAGAVEFDGSSLYFTPSTTRKTLAFTDSNITGSAGSVAFSGITSGTNSSAAMVIGAGATLDYASTGTINASSLIGGTWATPGAIGSTTPNSGAFTSLTTTGATTLGDNSSTVQVNSNTWDISTAGVGSGFTGFSSSGTITFSNYTGNNAVVFATTGTGVLSTATTSTSGQCLLSGASATYTPTWGSCGGGSSLFTADAGGVFTYLTSTSQDLLLGATTVSAGAFYLDITDGGTPANTTLSLGTDGSKNGILKLYSSTVGKEGTISMDASGNMTLAAATNGSVIVGSGTGNITLEPGTDHVIINLASTGDFLIQDNGTTFATFTDSGNVGIGTTTPIGLFSVEGAPVGKALVNLNYTGTDQHIFTASSSGTPRFVIANDGNVGIGTTDPKDLLHLNSSAPIMRFERNDTDVLTGEYLGRLEFYSMDSSTNLSGKVGSIDLVAGTGFTSGATPPGANTSMLFKVNTGNAGNPSEAMRIQFNGNVGIGGDTTPDSLLSVGSTSQFQVDSSGHISQVGGTAGTTLKITNSKLSLEYNASSIRIGSSAEISSIVNGTEKLIVNSTGIALADLNVMGTNNNSVLKFVNNSSANQVTIANAAASSNPSISATGTDTNISLSLAGKGTGGVILGGDVTLSSYTGNNAVLFGTTGTGVLSTATTSTSGLCLISGASTAYTPSWGSCSGSGGSTAWNAITAPAANLSLSMSTYTTALNWATGTTTTDLFSLTTDASANGTGSLLNIQTGIGSTVIPLRVRAGSTEALYVKTDGNVGIGTTNPLGLFEVLGSSGAMRIGTGGNVLEFTRNSANYLWASGAAATFEFSVGGSDPFNDNRKMILTSTGNLGLNDFSPGAHLEISANGSTGDLLMLSSNDANNGDLFIVKNSGNVGIGTIDPTGGKLHVVGDAYITGALYLPGAASSASTTEGTIYYNTDDDQLKVYANGKWQSDRTSVTKIVAASNSQNKEKADYVADGTADNVEIQAAIDALPTGGGTVVLLEGTYNIATAISLTKDGAKVVGQGHSTLLTRTDAGSILNVVGTAIDRVTDVTIGHLRFSGPSVVGTQVSGDGILVDYTDRVSIEKVWASGFGSLSDDGAVMILRSTACTVKDSSLSASKNGIVTGFATDAAGEVSHCTFSNNQVFSNYDDGIHTQHAKYITISDNHVYDNGTSGGDSAGIDTLGDSFDTITGNVVTGTTQKGIEIGNSTTAGVGDNNHTVSGNTIYNNGQAGILMGNDAKYITISNNTSNGNGTYGILLGTSSTTKEVVDNVVIGNTFTGNTTDGIRLTGNAHRNLVKDNVVLSNGGRGMYIVFASTEYPEDNIVENNRFASNTGAQFQDGGIRSIVRFNIGTTADVEFANASSNPVIDMFTFSNASSGMTTTGLDGLQIDFATAGTTASTDNAGLRINVTSNNSGATTTLEGIYIGNLTSAEANATETGLKIGTGWDVGVAVESGGITVSGGTISYSSGNRQARKMVLSAEYPGAVLFGDGTNNTGSLTSDYTNSTTGSRTTYYEWTSSEASLQDYTIVVRFTLPDNFGAWAASSPMVFSYATESTTASNNQVDISVFLQSGASADATDVDNVSGTVGTWTTTSDITTASLSECDAAGETCVIEFSMQSLSDNYVRIGDITLNYMANF